MRNAAAEPLRACQFPRRFHEHPCSAPRRSSAARRCWPPRRSRAAARPRSWSKARTTRASRIRSRSKPARRSRSSSSSRTAARIAPSSSRTSTRGSRSCPQDVQFRRVPVMFQQRWIPLAKIYYTLDALGEESKLSPDVFTAIHGAERRAVGRRQVLRLGGDQGPRPQEGRGQCSSRSPSTAR